MIEKIGRSGVELHQVRTNVDAEGNDVINRGKPNNGYLDGKRRQKETFNCNRMRSCGFGPSKIQCDESLPRMTKAQEVLLLAIDKGGRIVDPKNKVAQALCNIDLVVWSDRDTVWKTMAEGRRVADLVR